MGNVFSVQQGKSPYPRYVYHKDYNEPIRVDSLEDETPLLNQGWVTRYLHKEYPKWVNGVIVQDAEEHEKVLAGAKKDKKRTVKVKDRTYKCDVCGEVFDHPLHKANHVRQTGHKLIPQKGKFKNGVEDPEPQFKE